MKCPNCGAKINPAAVMGKAGGSVKSDAKATAARKNGLKPCAKSKKRGRPKKIKEQTEIEK